MSPDPGTETTPPPAAEPLNTATAADSEVVRISGRRPLDGGTLAVVALLALVVAQLVVGWFLLSSVNQLRDQSTAANGLQRCLINAQLAQVNSQDTSAYRKAVQSCLSR